MIYPSPYAGGVPRYPSELIEAGLEGVILFIAMLLIVRSEKTRQAAGMITGLFLTGYAIARIIAECFREPDAFLGFLPFGTTMGQILSLPMILIGLSLIWWGRNHRSA
jgi:phosphatidylglycerol:prolipoprotein diacylglycerol transferase